ncbi:MAG: hypothetical protein OXI10_09160, partial [Gammaproteobacteria bacterium]|nr:hypothetical protein [Gammaproteobacteria bacterium]
MSLFRFSGKSQVPLCSHIAIAHTELGLVQLTERPALDVQNRRENMQMFDGLQDCQHAAGVLSRLPANGYSLSCLSETISRGSTRS